MFHSAPTHGRQMPRAWFLRPARSQLLQERFWGPRAQWVLVTQGFALPYLTSRPSYEMWKVIKATILFDWRQNGTGFSYPFGHPPQCMRNGDPSNDTRTRSAALRKRRHMGASLPLHVRLSTDRRNDGPPLRRKLRFRLPPAASDVCRSSRPGRVGSAVEMEVWRGGARHMVQQALREREREVVSLCKPLVYIYIYTWAFGPPV